MKSFVRLFLVSAKKTSEKRSQSETISSVDQDSLDQYRHLALLLGIPEPPASKRGRVDVDLESTGPHFTMVQPVDLNPALLEASLDAGEPSSYAIDCQLDFDFLQSFRSTTNYLTSLSHMINSE